MRFGARLLRKNPGFALVSILSLALGIGANTTIFQLLDAVRLRTLPVEDPQQLARVKIVESPHCCRGDFYSSNSDLTGGLWVGCASSNRDSPAYRSLDHSPGATSVRAGRPAMQTRLMVSGEFFNVLGVQPLLGRLISPADDFRGCGAQGAVLSYAFWQREFGGGPAVLGSKLTLSGHPFQILGVAPAGFFGLEVGQNFDVAIPICSEPVFSTKGSLVDSPDSWWIATIGRLKPGWTIKRASAQLAAISPAIFAATFRASTTASRKRITCRSVWERFPRPRAFPACVGIMKTHCGCCWPCQGWCC